VIREGSGPSRVHYIHRMNYTARERVVGAFVLVALALLIGMLFAGGKSAHWFEERIYYHLFLKNAQGLGIESPVKISGIEVGRVSSLGISSDNRIHVTFFIYERFRDLVRADSRAAVGKLSIVGNATIDISAGSPEAELVPDGAILMAEEPLSLDELLAELTPVMEEVKRTVEGISGIVAAIDPEDTGATSRDLAATLANLRQISEQVADGGGALGRLLYDERLERHLEDGVASFDSTLARADRRMQELEPVLTEMTTLAGDTRQLVQRLTGLAESSTRLVEQMHGTVETVNVEMQQIPELMGRMQRLMDSTDRTLEGIQRIWPLSRAVQQPDTRRLIEVQPGHE